MLCAAGAQWAPATLACQGASPPICAADALLIAPAGAQPPRCQRLQAAAVCAAGYVAGGAGAALPCLPAPTATPCATTSASASASPTRSAPPSATLPPSASPPPSPSAAPTYVAPTRRPLPFAATLCAAGHQWSAAALACVGAGPPRCAPGAVFTLAGAAEGGGSLPLLGSGAAAPWARLAPAGAAANSTPWQPALLPGPRCSSLYAPAVCLPGVAALESAPLCVLASATPSPAPSAGAPASACNSHTPARPPPGPPPLQSAGGTALSSAAAAPASTGPTASASAGAAPAAASPSPATPSSGPALGTAGAPSDGTAPGDTTAILAGAVAGAAAVAAALAGLAVHYGKPCRKVQSSSVAPEGVQVAQGGQAGAVVGDAQLAVSIGSSGSASG